MTIKLNKKALEKIIFSRAFLLYLKRIQKNRPLIKKREAGIV